MRDYPISPPSPPPLILGLPIPPPYAISFLRSWSTYPSFYPPPLIIYPPLLFLPHYLTNPPIRFHLRLYSPTSSSTQDAKFALHLEHLPNALFSLKSAQGVVIVLFLFTFSGLRAQFYFIICEGESFHFFFLIYFFEGARWLRESEDRWLFLFGIQGAPSRLKN